MNTTTKPLFEETLNIVFECFEKYKHNRPLLPMNCLNNYQLIYNENQDNENLLRDDNQVFSERVSTRYSIRDTPSRASNSSRLLPRINTSRTSTTTETSTTSETILPVVLETTNLNKNIDSIESKEPIIKPLPAEQETEKERLLRLKTIRAKYTFKFPTRPFEPITTNIALQRSFSSAYAFNTIQRRKRVDLKPIGFNRKRNKQQQVKTLIRNCTDIEKKENTMIIEEDEQEQQTQTVVPAMIIEQAVNGDASTVVCPVY